MWSSPGTATLALLLVFFEAGWWSTALLAFACALGAATIANRSRMALKEARTKEPNDAHP